MSEQTKQVEDVVELFTILVCERGNRIEYRAATSKAVPDDTLAFILGMVESRIKTMIDVALAEARGCVGKVQELFEGGLAEGRESELTERQLTMRFAKTAPAPQPLSPSGGEKP